MLGQSLMQHTMNSSWKQLDPSFATTPPSGLLSPHHDDDFKENQDSVHDLFKASAVLQQLFADVNALVTTVTKSGPVQQSLNDLQSMWVKRWD
jgi:hypothetical protein